MSTYVSQTAIKPGLEVWFAFAALCDTTEYENSFTLTQLLGFDKCIFVYLFARHFNSHVTRKIVYAV